MNLPLGSSDMLYSASVLIPYVSVNPVVATGIVCHAPSSIVSGETIKNVLHQIQAGTVKLEDESSPGRGCLQYPNCRWSGVRQVVNRHRGQKSN